MHRSLRLTALLLAVSVSSASAAGVNLAWNDCGTFGQSSQEFDCLTNTGPPFPLIASFVPPPGIDEWLGLTAQVDVTSSTPTLPEWWKHGTGFCRGTTGMSVSVDFTSVSTSCLDPYQGQGVSSFAYDVNAAGPNHGRIRVVSAVPFDNRIPVDSSSEYAAFRVSLQRARSAPPGNCAGCSTPMCLVLNSITLYQPPEAGNDPVVSGSVNADYVTWQAASVPNCPLSTPTQSRTWGQVKSLYR